MNELIQACQSELSDNLPYLHHPRATMTAIARDIRKGFRVDASWGLLDVVGLVAGLGLFVLVVVPVGIAGRLTGRK